MDEYSTYELKCRNAHDKNFLAGTPESFQRSYFRVRDFTMLSRERLFDFHLAVQYVQKSSIPGDIVEVGCWGGGALAVALSALRETESSAAVPARMVYGFDTFEGHPEPSPDELDVWGNNQLSRFKDFQSRGESWCKVDIDQVRKNIESVCGQTRKLELVKGLAEVTIPQTEISQLAILRIDVDWYEPTLVCLQALYPKLTSGGVVIIDDYGHHSGSRKAVDEFFGEQHPKFTYIDYSCISFVKP